VYLFNNDLVKSSAHSTKDTRLFKEKNLRGMGRSTDCGHLNLGEFFEYVLFSFFESDWYPSAGLTLFFVSDRVLILQYRLQFYYADN